MEAVTRGFLIGLAIAAPVGPIAILCIRRTLVEGRVAGLVTGLGAASADATYAAIAAFSLTAVSDALVTRSAELRLAGAIFLLYLGARTVVAGIPVAAPVARLEASLPRAYLTAFLLTMANPMTILSFVAVFAGLGLAQPQRGEQVPSLLVAAVFLGSSAWWLFLTSVAGLARRRLQDSWLVVINRAAGLGIIAFGVAMLLRGRQ